MLVQTRNLPNNLPEVYIECVNGHSIHDDDDDSDHHDGSSSEEDHSRSSSSRDEDDDDDDHHRAQELKIIVYNHTVQFKNKRRVVVSIKDFFFYNILSHFPLAPFWSTQYRAYEIISFFDRPQTFVKALREINGSLSYSFLFFR